MKILHITTDSLFVPKTGIFAVLSYLPAEQNKIDGVESRVMALTSHRCDSKISHVDYIDISEVSDYISRLCPDIAIFHSFFHIRYASVCHYLRKKNIPFIIEPHGSFGSHAMEKSKLKKIIANHTIFRSMLRDSVGFIFTNKAESEDNIYKKDMVSVIPNGIFPEVVSNAKPKSFTDGHIPTFYFLGRYDINHKGIDYLLNALKIIDENNEDIKMIFYGLGNKDQLKFLHERIAGFTHINVLEKGPIQGEAKKCALENANILVLTSRYEGSPMTILDALSYGNPCVVTSGTNVSEEMILNKTGWVADLDAESIANVLLKAKIEYCEDYAGYYERSKKLVLDNYLWGNIAKFSIREYSRFIEKYEKDKRNGSCHKNV